MTELQRLYATWADFGEVKDNEVSSDVIPHLQLLSDVQESLFFEFVDLYQVDDGLMSIVGYALSQRTSEVYWETSYNSQMVICVEDAEDITPQNVFEIMRANEYEFLPEDTVWRLYITNTDYVILNVMQLEKLWKEEHPVGKSVPLDSARITALNKWFRGSKKERQA